MQNNHINLSSYDNVEDLRNFTDFSFKKYCDDKIKSCNKHIEFIKKLPLNAKKLKVFEIGSGNSKLLYALEKQALISSAIGLEISESRYEFAQKFKNYMKSRKVKNINKNIFDLDFKEQYDLIIGVDIVLQLISPINKGAETKVLKWINESLYNDGYLILELCSFEKILKQLSMSKNSLQLWEEFDKNDPFRYMLSQITLDKHNHIKWDKKFLKRDSLETSTFNNILKPYSKDEIVEILYKNNFKEIQVFDYWFEENDCIEDEYIVIAKK
jgi:hypothetical protein